MSLRIPAQPRHIYETNPIKLVVCQVRFSPLTQFAQPGFVAPFQEALGADFPRVTPEQQLSLQVGPAGVTPLAPTQTWRFQTADGNWSVVIGQDFASLETDSYVQFEDFDSRLATVLEALNTLSVKWR